MDYLPDEVLCLIFTFLPPQSKFFLRITCRKLFRIGSDPSLWKVIALSRVTPSSAPMVRSMVSFAGKALRTLRLVGDCLPSRYWSEVVKCSFLKKVEVYGARVTVTQLKKLLQHTTELTHVGFDMGIYKTVEFQEYLSVVRELSDVTVRMHTKRFVSLRHLIFAWGEQRYSPRHLAVVDLDARATDYPLFDPRYTASDSLQDCTSPIASLKVHTRNIMPLDLLPIPPILEVEVSEGGTLQATKTHICDGVGGQIYLNSVSEKELSGRYRPNQGEIYTVEKSFSLVSANLVHLDLTNMKSLLPEHLVYIGEHCSNLEQLILDNCDKCLASLDGLKEVTQKCPLKGLSLTGIMRGSIPCIGELWNSISSILSLVHLTIEGCLLLPSVSPAAPETIKPVKSSSGVSRISHMTQVAAPSLQVGILLGRLRRLSALGVHCFGTCDCCKKLTDKYLEPLSHLVGLAFLRVKGLPAFHYTKWLTAVFMNCPGLKYVYVSNTHGSVALPTDPNAYSNLEQLLLECPDQQLTNDCVAALISAGKLTHLFLVLNSMNADAVLKLARSLTHLVCFHVNIFQQVRNPHSLQTALKTVAKERHINSCDIVFKHALYRYPVRTYASAIASSELLPLASADRV